MLGYCPRCWNELVEVAVNGYPADRNRGVIDWDGLAESKRARVASMTVLYDRRGGV